MNPNLGRERQKRNETNALLVGRDRALGSGPRRNGVQQRARDGGFDDAGTGVEHRRRRLAGAFSGQYGRPSSTPFSSTNDAAFKSFKNTALGNLGVPMVMLRLFPEMFPDISGHARGELRPGRLRADPYEPTRVLPARPRFRRVDPRGADAGRSRERERRHPAPAWAVTAAASRDPTASCTPSPARRTRSSTASALPCTGRSTTRGTPPTPSAPRSTPTRSAGSTATPRSFSRRRSSGRSSTPRAPRSRCSGQLQAGSNFGAQRFAQTLGDVHVRSRSRTRPTRPAHARATSTRSAPGSRSSSTRRCSRPQQVRRPFPRPPR